MFLLWHAMHLSYLRLNVFCYIFGTLVIITLIINNKWSVHRTQMENVTYSIKKRVTNALVLDYDTVFAKRFQQLITRQASARDPTLISLVRDLIDPPSRHVFRKIVTFDPIFTPQSSVVDYIFQRATKGFFVECGALNGVRGSNSLALEVRRGWGGVLVEADPHLYTQLLGAARRAHSLNVCLSPQPHPLILPFRESESALGQLVDALGKETAHEPHVYNSRTVRMTPCVPLETVLLALNRTRVDYLSLDVEGYEMAVLRTIPFDRLDIRVLSVEYKHGAASKQAMRQYMESKGYTVYKDIFINDSNRHIYVFDYIFIKTDMWEKLISKGLS